VIQFRAGDTRAAGRVGGNSLAGFASTGAGSVLTWCPTCNIQMGEIVMPAARESTIGLQHVVPYIADHLDRLTPHFIRRVDRRVALHEHPGVPGVTEAVLKILAAIPGVTVVDLGQPRVGYMCNSLNPVPAYKRTLHAQELEGRARRGRRRAGRRLPRLPPRALRARARHAVPGRELPGAGGRGHGRRASRSAQALGR
jgi:hypothetical protein